MTDLRHRLEQLGLSQYFEVFVTEGFDTWETVLDVRESDLDSLNVKLGHRRKLQRAIADTRGIPLERLDRAAPHLHGAPSVDGSYRSDDSASESRSALKRAEPPSTNAGGTAKRKYRRHPKPDENAPERPASAYVIFSNQMRETLKGQELSFTEIAKLVGERWQTLSPSSREVCERQAASAKEKYYAELAEYKKTPEYARYQEYLAEFRAKHNPPQPEGKPSKVETETSASIRSSSHDHIDKSSRRRVSDAFFSQPSLLHHRSGSSPPPGPHRLSGRILPSESTSPATYSPRLTGRYSPMPASPTSASAFKEPEFFHPSASTHSTDSRERLQEPPYPLAHNHAFPQTTTPSMTPSSSSVYSGQAPSEHDLPSRRIRRESSSIPSLVHEDTSNTNYSSESYHSAQNAPPYQSPMLPIVDAQKAHRLLPQPIPSTLSMALPPLDQRPAPLQPPATFPAAQPQSQHELRANSSLAVLLRAGELARDADNPLSGKDNPP